MVLPILRASSTFSMSSGEDGSPRSANTFPLLSVNRGAALSLLRVATAMRSFRFLPFAVALFGILQARANEVHVAHRGLGALLGLLLECVKHVQRTFEFHCVDDAVSVAAFGNDQLQHLCTAKSV